jgi:glycosyltransferase involved in cell wall biosynthesis
VRPVKGFDVLVEAAALLRPSFPELRVLILGYGPPADVAKLRSLVTALGLGRSVELLGNRRDVADFVAAADVAVCASRWEGSSLSLLEYMEAGKPIVATAVGGNPGLLDGAGATLVEADDPAGIAAAVSDLLEDPGRAAAMGAANRARRRERFALGDMVARVEALYESGYTASRRRTHPWRRRSRPCYGSHAVRGGHGGTPERRYR